MTLGKSVCKHNLVDVAKMETAVEWLGGGYGKGKLNVEVCLIYVVY